MKKDQTQQSERYLSMRHVTLIGALVNILLSGLKIVFGWLGQSQALIADGLHSLSDLASDILVWMGAKHGSRGADENHPYGHARIETAATVAMSVLLIAVGAGVIIDAIRRLGDPASLLHPGPLALSVVVFSILSKEALFHYTMRVAKRVRSQLISANAWHHRTDSISSVIVLFGIAGSMLGVDWLDAAGAIGVGLMIGHIGWSLGTKGVKELVDTGLDAKKLAHIKAVILAVHGVKSLHLLRTRRMGEDALMDVHILVDPHLSVSEAHQIGETVRLRLIDKIEEINDVMVHIDPEDDEKEDVQQSNPRLPLRDEVMDRLCIHWRNLDARHHIEKVTLHYLAGKITVDIYLPLVIVSDLTEAKRLSEHFSALAKAESFIESISVYYR
ncbi:MAG: cation transporter [Gammaproteobacteria bacterium]|nr:cation transporter [Gammaproteobacteria bacterium]